MERELPGVLDGVEEPATVEELEAVVRRAGQRMRARLMAGAVALLAVGGVVGALARGPVAHDTPGVAAESDNPSLPSPPATGAMAVPYGPMPGWTLTPLFRREANGVAIRAYRSSLSPPAVPVPEQPVDPACLAPRTSIRVELSNGAAVGMDQAPDRPGDDLGVLGSGEFGRDEGEPVVWSVVRAPAGTTSVRLTAGKASDTMAPEGGIAVLAVPGGGAVATVEGLAADGKVLATRSLDQPPEPWFSPACAPRCVSGPTGEPVAVPVPAPARRGPAPPTTPADTVTTLAPGPPDPATSSRTALAADSPAGCGSSGHPGEPRPTSTTIIDGATSPASGGPLTTLGPPKVAAQDPVAPTTTRATAATEVPPPSTAPAGTAP